MLFQVITAPVVSQIVGRAAYRSGGIPEDALVVDELAGHLPADRPAADRTPADRAPADREDTA